MTQSIKIGRFILRGKGLIEYPDGKIIDLDKARPINIGIMQEEDKWNVTFLTEAALLRLKTGQDEQLNVVGFHFDNIDDAFLFHNTLAMYFMTDKKDTVNGTESN